MKIYHLAPLIFSWIEMLRFVHGWDKNLPIWKDCGDGTSLTTMGREHNGKVNRKESFLRLKAFPFRASRNCFQVWKIIREKCWKIWNFLHRSNSFFADLYSFKWII
jgi:hypothetical protein